MLSPTSARFLQQNLAETLEGRQLVREAVIVFIDHLQNGDVIILPKNWKAKCAPGQARSLKRVQPARSLRPSLLARAGRMVRIR